jgi:hypothetical protein
MCIMNRWTGVGSAVSVVCNEYCAQLRSTPGGVKHCSAVDQPPWPVHGFQGAHCRRHTGLPAGRPHARHPALPHNSRMPRDPVTRKASQQRYNQSDQGKAAKQRYNQSDQGKATAQRAASAAAERAAERAASAASASLAFLTELKKLPHAQRVSDYFSECVRHPRGHGQGHRPGGREGAAEPVRPGGAGARRPMGGLHLPRATRFNQRPTPRAPPRSSPPPKAKNTHKACAGACFRAARTSSGAPRAAASSA